MSADPRPIGIFDSGLGGLSVLKEVRQQLPHESILYVADQGRLPYGPRPVEEIRRFAGQITQFLLSQNVKIVVVACNTASAAALRHLRTSFPQVPFVGMEPAVKPAAQHSHSRIVGVIGTQSTVQSEVFASVVERFASGVTIISHACPGLVTQVEAGEFESPVTERLLHEYLDPMLAGGIDSLVLGCTHFAFLKPAIQRIVGSGVSVIDPAPAIARQVGRLIASNNVRQSNQTVLAFTTGLSDPSALATQMVGESLQFQSLSIHL